MNKGLLSINDYYVFTFASTSHALKAEEVLKEAGADFIIMPTLREISSSCGLSVKIDPVNLELYRKVFSNNHVAVEEIYHVEKQDRNNNITKLPN